MPEGGGANQEIEVGDAPPRRAEATPLPAKGLRDLVVDLIMPRAELDGLGFLSGLAASHADVPIILISGLGEALAQGVSPRISSALRIAAILG